MVQKVAWNASFSNSLMPVMIQRALGVGRQCLKFSLLRACVACCPSCLASYNLESHQVKVHSRWVRPLVNNSRPQPASLPRAGLSCPSAYALILLLCSVQLGQGQVTGNPKHNGSSRIEICFSLFPLREAGGPKRREAVQGFQVVREIIRPPCSFCLTVLPCFLWSTVDVWATAFIPTFQAAGWTKGRRKHFSFFIFFCSPLM